MNISYKSVLALAALSLAAISVRAQTLDLIVGFAQSGAANDVEINFGSTSNYAAPGVYNLGNYATVLSANFTNWNTATGASTVQFGAVAANATNGLPGRANPVWITSSWNTSVNGVLGAANSADYTGVVASQINGIRVGDGKVNNGYGAFVSTGFAKTVSASDAINSWTANAQPAAASAFGLIDSAKFNTGVSDLANNGLATFAAADIYQVSFGTPNAGLNQTFFGTLAIFQNGDVALYTTAAAIPEPSTYAALLGAATLGVVAYRRRRQAALETV